jgi:hypothetical protein
VTKKLIERSPNTSARPGKNVGMQRRLENTVQHRAIYLKGDFGTSRLLILDRLLSSYFGTRSLPEQALDPASSPISTARDPRPLRDGELLADRQHGRLWPCVPN